MKQQKDNWVKILFSFAAPCKGKMALSVFCAILSVAGGFIPFWAVYEILLAFINQNVTLNGILIWCLVGAAGYLLRVAWMIFSLPLFRFPRNLHRFINLW